MTLYMRHKIGEERRSPPGRFGPLDPIHPLVGATCMSCLEEIKAGDIPTLYALGPELDDMEKADAGRWYSAYCTPMHESCAWGEVPRGR